MVSAPRSKTPSQRLCIPCGATLGRVSPCSLEQGSRGGRSVPDQPGVHCHCLSLSVPMSQQSVIADLVTSGTCSYRGRRREGGKSVSGCGDTEH